MTDQTATDNETATRRANLQTTVRDPAVVAAALRPDNTDEMHTRVTDTTIETVIERPTTGGLRTTVDDYVCNLSVATAVLVIADDHGTTVVETDADTADASTQESTDEHFHTDTTDTP